LRNRLLEHCVLAAEDAVFFFKYKATILFSMEVHGSF
jgi:hypothetical protein